MDLGSATICYCYYCLLGSNYAHNLLALDSARLSDSAARHAHRRAFYDTVDHLAINDVGSDGRQLLSSPSESLLYTTIPITLASRR